MITGIHSPGAGPGRIELLLALMIIFVATGASQCRTSEADPAARESSTPVSFTDITAAAGLEDFRHVTGAAGAYLMPETLGGGGGFIDYDGDGLLDIVLVRGADWKDGDDDRDQNDGGEARDVHDSTAKTLALFRNMGDGTFTDRTIDAGLHDVASYAFGVTVADYDDDGDDDFFLTTLHRNMLFRNDDGYFVEVGEAAGVAGPSEWSTAAVFLDADVDGRLDLYVGNYVEWSPETDMPCALAGGVRSYCTPDTYSGLPGRFYRNDGDGTFTERTAEAGFEPPVPGKTLAAAQLDYNKDGRPDLVVVNDTERDLLYQNNGDGTFEEIGVVSGIAYDRNGKARAGMGIDVGVMDSTGHPTVFIANFAREKVGAYQYTGNGRFVDRAQQARIGQASMNLLSFGVVVFDVDLDGHLDLITANGHINPEVEEVDGTVAYRQPVRVYKNQGDGSFAVVAPAGGGDVLDKRMVARGVAYGDIDRDGDVDVLLIENGGPAHLWRNDAASSGNGFLRVQLEGRASNRRGIGARVEAVVGSRRMTQFVRTGSSYLSSSETTLTFGLGKHSMVDSLIVHWPSGRVDAHVDVPGHQEICVSEDQGYTSVWKTEHAEGENVPVALKDR